MSVFDKVRVQPIWISRLYLGRVQVEPIPIAYWYLYEDIHVGMILIPILIPSIYQTNAAKNLRLQTDTDINH